LKRIELSYRCNTNRLKSVLNGFSGVVHSAVGTTVSNSSNKKKHQSTVPTVATEELWMVAEQSLEKEVGLCQCTGSQSNDPEIGSLSFTQIDIIDLH
jgi:hypothetical protein